MITNTAKLENLFTENLIKVGLDSATKEGVIKELVNVLKDAGKINDTAAITACVLEREAAESTGLENGVAIPHAKTELVDNMVGALGVSKDGIEFDSHDKKPSYLFFLLIAPAHVSGPHLKALASIARLCQSPDFVALLKNASSSEEVHSLIKRAEL